MGKYGVTVSVGPATETKRALANEQMMAFVNAAPQTAASVMDLIAEAQDWPKSGEFARRFKMQLPPGMVPEDEMTPEMQQMQAANQQMQQMQQELAQAQAQATIADLSAKAKNNEARANLALAQAYKAVLDAQSRKSDVEGKNDERLTNADNVEFDQVMKTLDQHNALAHEDRDFDLRDMEFQSRKNGEQENDNDD